MKPPLILFGTGRSGTTILMEALFRHSEFGYFSNYLDKLPSFLYLNYIRFIFDNRFFRTFGEKPQLYKLSLFNNIINKPSEGYNIWNYLFQNEINFSRDFMMNKDYQQYSNDINEYLNKCCLYQQKDRFAIKITGPSRLSFLYSTFPHGNFLWLKRSFIPTLDSFLKVDFWQPRKTGDLWWTGAYNEKELSEIRSVKNDPILFTALQLKKIIQTTENDIKNMALNCKVYKYEDFVDRSELVLAEILDWLGISREKVCFEYIKKNKLTNRNKLNSAYFDLKTLRNLEKLLGEEFIESNTF